MLDWKKIVREKLGALPMEAAREDEIVEELAQQLETAYHEELAHGAGPAEAARRSLRQFQNWEKLRHEVFESAAGARLPVWEQRGIVSPRRLPVWIALAIALTFLAMPSFRKALRVLPVSGGYDAWSSTTFSAKNLARLESAGDTQKYARALAYVALHSPDDHQAALAAEKAIALDPQLTWICAKVSHPNYPVPGHDPKPWLDRLEAWDPDNAYVYLLEADAAVPREVWARFSLAPDVRHALVNDRRWLIPMEKAFSAPRWNLYVDRQFALDRQVLLENGLDHPEKLMMAAASKQVPNFTLVQMYADYLVLDVGANEEKAGHSAKALAAYYQVASFAQKLGSGPTDIEKLYSAKLAKQSYQPMIALLRTEGRSLESDSAALSLAAAQAQSPIHRRQSGWKETPAFRAGQIGLVSGLFLLLLAFAALVWLLCVGTLRVRPNLSRAMNWAASYLGRAVILVPLPCLTLYLSYLPYSASIASFSSPEILYSTSSYFVGVRFVAVTTSAWIEHMFWPLVWCAAILVLGAILLLWMRSRQHSDRFEAE